VFLLSARFSNHVDIPSKHTICFFVCFCLCSCVSCLHYFQIPYFALNANLKARFESVLFHYKEGQVSGIVFHRNLFTVVLKAPILYANWYVLSHTHIMINLPICFEKTISVALSEISFLFKAKTSFSYSYLSIVIVVRARFHT